MQICFWYSLRCLPLNYSKTEHLIQAVHWIRSTLHSAHEIVLKVGGVKGAMTDKSLDSD